MLRDFYIRMSIQQYFSLKGVQFDTYITPIIINLTNDHQR
jgi:hypothetical protein